MTKQPLGSNKYVSWVLYVKFRIHKRDCLLKHFAFLKKVCHQVFKFCAWSKLLFFLKLSQSPVSGFCCSLRAADQPTASFLGMYFYFPAIQLVNFVLWPRLQESHCSTLKGIALLSLEALKHAAAVLVRVCLRTRERFRVVFASRFMIPTRLFLQIHDSRRLLITWT